MPTNLMTGLFDKGIIVKEGYQTVKKRLFTAGDFIEVTDKGGKVVFNKSCIKSAAPVLAEKKIKAVKKEEDQDPLLKEGKDG